MSNRYWIIAIAAVFGANAAAPASASEMVYHPVNPTFGGNPLNGSTLLSTAQAQGTGTKSGAQAPDLSGLNSALSNLGSGAVVIGGNGSNGNGTNNNSGSTVP
jgi:curli production assembly/transport component CsgF